MKKRISTFNGISILRYSVLIISMLLLNQVDRIFAAAASENDTTVSVEKVSVNLTLAYKNINDSTREIHAKVTRKEGKKWIPVENVIINLYLDSVSRAGMMGSMQTDRKGMVNFPLVNKFRKANDTLNNFKFIARIMEDSKYEDTRTELLIKDSKLKLSFTEEDSVRTAKILFTSADEKGNETPVPDIELKFYVQRTYGLLPIGESVTTDEAGEASIEIPAGIPGDEKGMIEIVARLEDNETFGEVIAKESKSWGSKTVYNNAMDSRTLWASRENAPISLVLIVNAMLIGIWGTIFYIIYLMLKIKRLGSNS